MVHMMLYTPVRSLTLVEQQEVWNDRQRKIKNLMCQIDKKEALSVIADKTLMAGSQHPHILLANL